MAPNPGSSNMAIPWPRIEQYLDQHVPEFRANVGQVIDALDHNQTIDSGGCLLTVQSGKLVSNYRFTGAKAGGTQPRSGT